MGKPIGRFGIPRAAPDFAEWLAELLDASHPSRSSGSGPLAEASGLHIVVTDGDGHAAEVVFDGEWTWDSEVDLPLLRQRLRLTEEK